MTVVAGGERVVLVSPRQEHAPELARLNAASAALHASWVEAPVSLAAAAAFLAACERGSLRGLLVRRHEDGALVGVVTLRSPRPPQRGTAEVACYVGAGYERRGYMTAALRLALSDRVLDPEIARVVAWVQPRNVASTRLFARLDFRPTARPRRLLRICGEWREHEPWELCRGPASG